jgi:hypothetical protein
MATKSNLRKLVFRALNSSGFHKELKSDPQAALKKIGIAKPSASLIKEIKGIDFGVFKKLSAGGTEPGC